MERGPIYEGEKCLIRNTCEFIVYEIHDYPWKKNEHL